METAGKFVDDDELRDAMKENGIGRPSTRAAIIETLFKRRYIKKERKNLVPTPTGIELINLIHEELLKSAELTGIWEKKLRDIEYHKYSAQQFIDELKQMVVDIVTTVRNDNSNRRVVYTTDEELKKKKTTSAQKTVRREGESPAGFKPRGKKTETAKKTDSSKASESVDTTSFNEDQWIGMTCPVCKQGTIIKGKSAYGCSRWREGCSYRMPFEDAIKKGG
jgi:DNA topoisomerase-3